MFVIIFCLCLYFKKKKNTCTLERHARENYFVDQNIKSECLLCEGREKFEGNPEPLLHDRWRDLGVSRPPHVV